MEWLIIIAIVMLIFELIRSSIKDRKQGLYDNEEFQKLIYDNEEFQKLIKESLHNKKNDKPKPKLNQLIKKSRAKYLNANKEKFDANNLFEKALKKYGLRKKNDKIKPKDTEKHTQSTKKKKVEPLNVANEVSFKKPDKSIINTLDKFDIAYIYHMTHINNLQNILNYGLLSHRNNVVNNRIDNPEVNSRRNFIEPIYNKNVHSYVPFYFNPRNAMLYVNRKIQDDLVILAFDRKLIYQQGSLFTDGNASANNTKFYNSINDLDKLNWKCLKSKYWNDFEDGKRLMMAEILVPDRVDINNLKKIYCINFKTKKYLKNLISNHSNIKIEVNSKIFF